MKKSFFNIFLETNDENCFFVFNTLHGSLVQMDKEGKENLEDGSKLDLFNADVISQLMELKMIVPDEEDELIVYRHNLLNQRYNPEFSEFMISTTYCCNLNCPYCFEGVKPATMLGDKLSQNILKFIKNTTLENKSASLKLHLFGGEPFLNWRKSYVMLSDLKKFSEHHKLDFSIIIYTNGTIASDEIIDQLKLFKQNISYLQITIDGPERVHDSRRFYKNKAGSYKRIISNMHRFKDAGIKCVIRVNVDKSNYEYVPALLDDLKLNNLADIPLGFGFVREMTSACGSIKSEILEPGEYLIGLWEGALIRGINVATKPKPVFNYCSAFTKNSYVIDVDGYVYKCAGLQGVKTEAIGIIDDEGNHKWNFNYEKFLSRDPSLVAPCNQCRNLPICGGGCASYSFTKFGKYHVPNCFNKNLTITKEGLRLFLKYKGPEEYRVFFD